MTHSPTTPTEFDAGRSLEQEYARIARDLHDELGGDFVAINMAVAQLRATLASSNASQKACDVIEARVKAALESMHRLIDDLRPAILDSGVVAALRWRAEQFTRVTGLPCELVSDAEDIPMQDQRAASVLRLFGEALTNVARHAHANEVSAQLTHTAQELELVVQDDGIGLPAELAGGLSQGLRNMRHRADALGGTLEFATVQDQLAVGMPGRGARLILRIPAG